MKQLATLTLVCTLVTAPLWGGIVKITNSTGNPIVLKHGDAPEELGTEGILKPGQWLELDVRTERHFLQIESKEYVYGERDEKGRRILNHFGVDLGREHTIITDVILDNPSDPLFLVYTARNVIDLATGQLKASDPKQVIGIMVRTRDGGDVLKEGAYRPMLIPFEGTEES